MRNEIGNNSKTCTEKTASTHISQCHTYSTLIPNLLNKNTNYQPFRISSTKYADLKVAHRT